MDYSVFKRAARGCIRNSRISPQRISAVYALILSLLGLLPVIAELLLSEYYGIDDPTRALAAQPVWQAKRALLFYFAGSLLITILTSLLQFGYANYTLRLSRCDSASRHDLFRPLRHPLRILGFILLLVVLVVAVVTGCLTLLTLLPASLFSSMLLLGMAALAVWLFLAYRYVIYVYLDNPALPFLEILTRARLLTRGYRKTILRLDLSFLWYVLLLGVVPSILPFLLDILQDTSGASPVSFPVSLLLTAANYLIANVLLQRQFLPYVETSSACCYNALCDISSGQTSLPSGAF